MERAGGIPEPPHPVALLSAGLEHRFFDRHVLIAQQAATGCLWVRMGACSEHPSIVLVDTLVLAANWTAIGAIALLTLLADWLAYHRARKRLLGQQHAPLCRRS